MILSSGIHRIDAAAYHADPAPRPSLSSTLARTILAQSPRHAWTISPRLNPDCQPRDTNAFDVGRAAHRVVLGVGADWSVIPPDLLSADGGARTKEARQWIEEQRAAGVTPLKQADADRIDAMAAAVAERLAAMRIRFDPERSEIAALAEIDGVWCRAMIDNAPADARLPLYDFKTTTDASIAAVERAICSYGYDVQAQFYLDVWKAATGEDRRFRFVFVEKDAPHEVAVVELQSDAAHSADWMADAREKCAEARSIWRECLGADLWPGYPAAVAVIGAPPWHRARWAERPERMPITRPSRAALDAARVAQAPGVMQ